MVEHRHSTTYSLFVVEHRHAITDCSLWCTITKFPVFVWLNTDRSRPRRVERRPLPFSTHLSLRPSMLRCPGLSTFRKFLKSLSTSAPTSCRSDAILPVHYLRLRPAQQIYSSLSSRRQCTGVCQSEKPIPGSTSCSRFTESVNMMARVT